MVIHAFWFCFSVLVSCECNSFSTIDLKVGASKEPVAINASNCCLKFLHLPFLLLTPFSSDSFLFPLFYHCICQNLFLKLYFLLLLHVLIETNQCDIMNWDYFLILYLGTLGASLICVIPKECVHRRQSLFKVR